MQCPWFIWLCSFSVFNIFHENNPEIARDRCRTVMRPPQVLQGGTQKTRFVDFIIHEKHMLSFSFLNIHNLSFACITTENLFKIWLYAPSFLIYFKNSNIKFLLQDFWRIQIITTFFFWVYLLLTWVVISYKYIVTSYAILTVSIVLGCIGTQTSGNLCLHVGLRCEYYVIWVNLNPACLVNGLGFLNPNTTCLLNG